MATELLAAFGLTVLAGLSTAVGGLVVLRRNRPSERLLALGLGLSAGVMVYVSFMELLPRGTDALGPDGSWLGPALFFAGMGAIMLIDRLVPLSLNPHEPADPADRTADSKRRGDNLMRTGVMTAAALTIHNLPEGFATLVSGLDDLRSGTAIAAAIAMHNIPEGVAVAVPILAATGSRRKAFGLAAASGLAEPVGAALLYLLLAPLISPQLLGGCLCLVAGVMVFISLDELLPTAEKFGEHHAAVYGVVAGMAAMAVSLGVLG